MNLKFNFTRGVAASGVTGSTATVTIGGKTYTAQVARGLALAIGDPVLLAGSGTSWTVLARTHSGISGVYANDDAPDPQPLHRSGQLVVHPVETRTWLVADAKWRTDSTSTFQGERGTTGLQTGCAFYGVKPTSLSGATVNGAWAKLKREAGGAYTAVTPTLRLVTQSVRPSGAPTLTSTATGPALAVGDSDNGFVIPTAWAQAMVDGTAGGLAVHGTDGAPYARLSGIDDWSPAWVLTIDWTR